MVLSWHVDCWGRFKSWFLFRHLFITNYKIKIGFVFNQCFDIHSTSATEISPKLSLQPYTTRNCLSVSLCVIESLLDVILTYLDIFWLEVFFTSINTIFLYIEWLFEAIHSAISCALRPSVLVASKFQCLSTFYKIHNRESNSFHQAECTGAVGGRPRLRLVLNFTVLH